MARSDLLLKILKAAQNGDSALLRRSAEALIADERAQNHNILADRLEETLRKQPTGPEGLSSRSESGWSSLVHEVTPRRGLEDLILDASLERLCAEFVDEQHRTSLLRSYNLEPRHRILLIGPPGNGKTSLAEALAYELALPLYTARYEGVITSFLGETAAKVASLFDFVRTRKCVLFFDEFDAIAKERGDPHDTGEVKRVVSSLLLQVDTLPSHVIVVAATNHQELLDRAVWRRFQIRLTMKQPSVLQRRRMLARLSSFFEGDFSTETDNLAKRLVGASYSDLNDFMSDVQRKYVLGLPTIKPKDAIRFAMKEWSLRTTLRGTEELDG